MEALLNDFGHVFLLELMMACAITLCGCYTTYTDIHFRHIPNWASWGLLAVGLVSQGLFWIWGQVELDRAGLVHGDECGVTNQQRHQVPPRGVVKPVSDPKRCAQSTRNSLPGKTPGGHLRRFPPW